MKINNNLLMKVNEKSLTDFYGQFTLEPLLRGFGITIGNAIRRTLMTSIPGAAIISVKAGGVLHEFASIEGVKEEMVDIIMNLKMVRFKLLTNRPEKVVVSLSGPHTFTAKDIGEATNQFVVMNPDLYIATLNKNANFTMELQVGIGKGYVDAESHQRVEPPIGTIFIDSIYNPVTKVTYDVKPVSSEKGAAERLILEVFSDGTISPRDCIHHASQLLLDHFRPFIYSDAKPVLETPEGVDPEILRVRTQLDQSIDEMELSVRSHNCLQGGGIRTIGDLVSKTESEMLKFKNFGRKSLNEILEKLSELGLSLGMDVSKYKLPKEK